MQKFPTYSEANHFRVLQGYLDYRDISPQSRPDSADRKTPGKEQAGGGLSVGYSYGFHAGAVSLSQPAFAQRINMSRTSFLNWSGCAHPYSVSGVINRSRHHAFLPMNQCILLSQSSLLFPICSRRNSPRYKCSIKHIRQSGSWQNWCVNFGYGFIIPPPHFFPIYP